MYISVFLSWFNPCQHSGLTQLLTHSPTSGTGESVGRIKAGKLLGWDKGTLIEKAKAVQTSKAKQGISSLLPMGRQEFSHLLERAGPHHMWWWLGGQTASLQKSPLPPSFPSLYTEQDVTWSEISLGSLGVTCPSCVPSQPPHQCGSTKSRKALALCEPSSATTETSLDYQSCV